jgi:tetratricopeptide (TPR) repeat protein
LLAASLHEEEQEWEQAYQLLQALDESHQTEQEEAGIDRQADFEQLTRLGRLAQLTDRPRASLDYYRRALHVTADLNRADRCWSMIIEVHSERGDSVAAGRAADRRAKQWATPNPARSADAYFKAGEIWLKQAERRTEALAAFREALALQPEHWPTLDALESLLGECSDEGPALCEILAKKADLVSHNHKAQIAVLHRLAAVSEKLGDTVRATEACQRIVARNSADVGARSHLARAAWDSKSWDEAAEHYAVLAAPDIIDDEGLLPNSRAELQRESHDRLARIGRLRKDSAAEEHHLRTLLDATPLAQAAPIISRLEELLIEQHREERLVDLIEGLLRRETGVEQQRQLLPRLAQLYQSMGHDDRARLVRSELERIELSERP